MAPSVLQEEAETKQGDLLCPVDEEDSWVSQEMGAWGDLVELSGELRNALGGERAYRKVRAQRERMINDGACQGNFETSMPNMNCWSVYLQIYY